MLYIFLSYSLFPKTEALGHSSIPEKSNSSAAALFKSSIFVSGDRLADAYVASPLLG